MDAAAKLSLFERIALPHLNAAFNLARWMTRNDHDAEDVVQESYLRAFHFFDSFNGTDGRAWLLAVVRNTCLTMRRRSRASVEFDERAHSPSVAADVELSLLQKTKTTALRECLEDLPLEFREVIVMREMEEMAYREVAEACALPMGTVMSRLARARKRLADCVTGRLAGAAK